MKKILFFLSAFPKPIDDGIKKIVNNLINTAIKNSYEVTLVVPNSTEKLDYEKSVEIMFYEKKRTLLSVIKDLFLLQPLYFGLYYNKYIDQKIDRNAYDLVIYDFYPMTQYSQGFKHELFMMPDTMKDLALSSVKNSKSYILKTYHFMNYLLSSIYNQKIKNLKKLYVSNEDILIDNLPNSFFIRIPSDEVDLSQYFDIQIDKNEISFRGVMNFEPNQSAVKSFYNDVFLDLIKLYPKIQLKIIGKNPPKDLILQCDQNTLFTGFVDDVFLEMNKSFIHIVPMISGTGVKTKMLDSMALKRVVFATPKALNGIFESIEEAKNNGILVYENREQFLDLFSKLYNNEINYKDETNKAYSFIKQNSYKKLLNHFWEIKNHL